MNLFFSPSLHFCLDASAAQSLLMMLRGLCAGKRVLTSSLAELAKVDLLSGWIEIYTLDRETPIGHFAENLLGW